MTKKRSYPYAIYYRDGSYMIYDLTADDFESVRKCMTNSPVSVVELSVGILDLSEVRSIIKQRQERAKNQDKGANPDLTMDAIAYLNQFRTREDDEDDEDEGMMQ